eukprot:scpid64202/ scgid5317/ 
MCSHFRHMAGRGHWMSWLCQKAIDKENVSPQTSLAAPVSASPASAPPAAVTAAAASSPSPLGPLFSAQGSTWSNVTINVTPQLPEKRKNRPSLKLKKKPKKKSK